MKAENENIELISDLLELDRQIFDFLTGLMTRLPDEKDLNLLSGIEQLSMKILVEYLGQDYPDEDFYDEQRAEKLFNRLFLDSRYDRIARVLRPVGKVKNRQDLVRKLKRLHDAARSVQFLMDY